MHHIPVLLKEVTESIKIPVGGILVDGTFGSGGHSVAIANTTNGPITIIGFDRDGNAVKEAEKISSSISGKLILRKANFRDIDQILNKEGIKEVDGILLDLGFSSDQLEDSGRGFSFRKDEPLLMTLGDDPKAELFTASDVVNLWEKENLELIIRNYGEEYRFKKIVDLIIKARQKKKIETSKELATIIEKGIGRKGKIHPATKTFQAIRIAVNDELGALTEVLPKTIQYLKKGGRLGVISFHSLEDRIVKKFFKDRAEKQEIIKITKKPLISSREESLKNPRSRSAKFRVVEKV